MKVKIEIEEGLAEEEIIIRCGTLNDAILSLQNYIYKQSSGKRCLALLKEGTEYYIPMEELYFFETTGREVTAHTADDSFSCGYKLYELEELLPGGFMRISKSSIANLDYIYSITRSLTSSSMMEFRGSTKRVYVSRAYFKAVAERLNARKLMR